MSLEAWLEHRLLGIGGSDAGVVHGCNPYESAYALWAQKVGLDDSVKPDNNAMEWGRRLEPVVLDKLQDEHPEATVIKGTAHPRVADNTFAAECVYRDPEHAIWRSAEHPYMQATPDGFMVYSDGRVLLVEVKTSRDRWDDVPPYIYAQVQHNLAVFGLRQAVVPHLALAARCYNEWWLLRDDSYIEQLIESERNFWKCVEENDAPPFDSSEATTRILDAREPIQDIVDLPPEALAWDERLRTVDELRLKYEREHDRLRSKLKAAIGDHEAGRLPNGVVWTYRKESHNGYHVEASENRVLRRRSA